MKNGLHVLKNNGSGILLDTENLFWAISHWDNESGFFISEDVLALYAGKKKRLSNEMQNFRFSANLSALYIDPTDRCNANCPYCYIPSKIRKSGRSMTKEELFLILNKAAKYFSRQKKKAVIVFHAAEPLLVKDIVFAAIKEFNKEFKFGLQTNATLLEEDDAKFLMDQGVGVGISLDYYSPKINNALRPVNGKAGNFNAAMQAIKWFKGYEGMNVITTITKLNVQGLPEIVEFMHKNGVPCLLLNPVRLTQKNSRALKPDDKVMAKYFIQAVDKAIELSRNSDHKIIIGNFTNIILGIVSPAARRLMCDISPCGGGRCFLTVTAKGEMIPCGEFIGLKGFSGGNIFKVGIEEAMQSAPFKKIRSRFVENVQECDVCLLRNICGSPCPAELHALGNIRQKSVFCEFYKQIINHAFKLIASGQEKYCFRDNGLNNLEYEYRLLKE